MHALRNYCIAVGRKTINIIKSLKTENLKKRVEAERLQRIREEGAVVEEARWLIEYWSKKTFSGLRI